MNINTHKIKKVFLFILLTSFISCDGPIEIKEKVEIRVGYNDIKSYEEESINEYLTENDFDSNGNIKKEIPVYLNEFINNDIFLKIPLSFSQEIYKLTFDYDIFDGFHIKVFDNRVVEKNDKNQFSLELNKKLLKHNIFDESTGAFHQIKLKAYFNDDEYSERILNLKFNLLYSGLIEYRISGTEKFNVRGKAYKTYLWGKAWYAPIKFCKWHKKPKWTCSLPNNYGIDVGITKYKKSKKIINPSTIKSAYKPVSSFVMYKDSKERGYLKLNTGEMLMNKVKGMPMIGIILYNSTFSYEEKISDYEFKLKEIQQNKTYTFNIRKPQKSHNGQIISLNDIEISPSEEIYKYLDWEIDLENGKIHFFIN